jgi:predicted RecB family nuclease
MHSIEGYFDLSPSDLSNFLACHHRTALDMAVALKLRPAPRWIDPAVALLQERGLNHERNYANHLKEEGLSTTDITAHNGQPAVAATLQAMASGIDVIVQPALRDGRWLGRPDILRKVGMPSSFGDWSYEAADTKLARETRGATILQLATYSDMLRAAQQTLPESFHVVTPDPKEPVKSYRVQDFAAYFRLIRAQLEHAIAQNWDTLAIENYPEPVEHCEVCRWRMDCDRRRREDDHLSLVAGISRLQTRELQERCVVTLARLGKLPLPLSFKPKRGAVQTYEKIREQARIQLTGRTRNEHYYELLAIEPGQGLTRLPPPSAGDLFLDLEGDPFVSDDGREYLFGLVEIDNTGKTKYNGFWATNHREEREAFATAVKKILESWSARPAMHVYHYAPYEPSALKRLMGRHAIHEDDIDRMLRAGIFVDLYSVVRHTLRASVERYSIKDLEPFYGFERSLPLEEAGTHRRIVEAALELGSPDAIGEEDREAVEAYNRDDCLSARGLRNWLEHLRASLENKGTIVPRPEILSGEPSEAVDERSQKIQELVAKLASDVPSERDERSEEQHARWLLANMLEWHRREDKCVWWEFFRLRDLPEDELLDERAALSDLKFVKTLGGTKKCPLDRYSFPAQDTEIGEGAELHLSSGGEAFGTVESMDLARRTVNVKKRGAHADTHPTAVFAHSVVPSRVLADSLLRIAEDVALKGIARSKYRPAAALLLRKPPTLRGTAFEQRRGESAVDFAKHIVPFLDNTFLAIQGPPGAGKTYTGALMICELVRRGLRVGVTAVSHKVIRNFLDAVVKAASESELELKCAQKVNDIEATSNNIEAISSNEYLLEKLSKLEVSVAGGTAWFWARPDAARAVDVLFIDEAGQMSLANALAVSTGAKNLVLLGDPQQLEQPQQGTHPEGTDVSALDHVLNGNKTMTADQGIFLPETWRLAPSICDFTSEVFYENRLRPVYGLERQTLRTIAEFAGAGLFFVPVTHQGNQNYSTEEVEVVVRIVTTLLRKGSKWINKEGEARTLRSEDVLVVAPYNAHVSKLGERLASNGVRVGTVDKFQGQEAPVVIYSMATSTPEDAPRGMEFLYSLNRLNVATSRARCACILVASARLMDPECKSPRQMKLANALCRYVELAKKVDID